MLPATDDESSSDDGFGKVGLKEVEGSSEHDCSEDPVRFEMGGTTA